MNKYLVGAALLIVLGAGGIAFMRGPDPRKVPAGVSGKEPFPVPPPAAAKDCPHGLPTGACPFCDPALVEKKGSCPEHGVPEALCTKCQPALVDAFKKQGDWCGGHSVPESQCTTCNPGQAARSGPGEKSATPPLVLAPEPSRTQLPPSVTCQNHTRKISFASPETARNAGLECAVVTRQNVTPTVPRNAEIAYDANRHAHLSPRAPGVVSEVRKDLGQVVSAGEVLVVIDAADLGTAKAEYLQALALVALGEKNHGREQGLLEKKVGTEQAAQEAETRLAESRISLSRASQRLRNLGVTEEIIRKVGETRDTSSLLPLVAPFAGTVVERAAVIGEVVDTQTSLMAVADTTRMWAMLDVYEADVPQVRVGQPVVVEIEGLPGRRQGGRVTWISSQLDRRTRTLRVRTELANPDGLLRAGMFGKALLQVRDGAPVLVVPRTAVQWDGCCNVVFVRKSDMFFEPRKVQLGYEIEGYYVVESGVNEGEEVVTTGSFLLKTEILKGSIGAGCCPE